MNYAMLLFCDVDDEGNILPSAVFGKNALPTQQYDYFFYLEEGHEDTDVLVFSEKYKVVLDGYKASLVLK
jgi:hypothetical protein